MKNIISYMFIFNCILSFSQMQIFVVLKPSVYLVAVNSSNPYSQLTTSDTGLNQIMSNNNAQFFQYGQSNCYLNNFGSETFGSISLLNELNNYSNAVEIAYPTSTNPMVANVYASSINVELTNSNIGNYISTNNNIVVTNNSDLNAIFQTYNVFSFIKDKIISCDCNADNLQNALTNLLTIVSNAENCSGIVFLVNNSFYKANEFKFFVRNKYLNIISGNNDLKTISIYNLLGKELISIITSQPINIDQLSTGIYIVKVTVNNISKTFKIAI